MSFDSTVASDPWFGQSLFREERVDSLLAAMTVEEKIGQLRVDSTGIPRLGILPNHWWNEGLHGVARTRLHSGQSLRVAAELANTGTIAISEVAQLCITIEDAGF